MMSDFQSFLDSVMHVPAEFERNITLLRTLDTRVRESMDAFNDLIKKYKGINSKSERLKIRGEMDKLEKKLDSYSLDKCAVADQTYRLIDDTVVQMNLLKTQKGKDKEEMTPLLVNMPEDDYEPRYCHCRGISYGEMVACDNEDCPIEWFHYGCVGVTEPPRGKWYCKNCKDCITIRLPKISLDGLKSEQKTRPRLKSKQKSRQRSGATKRKSLRS